MIKIIINTHDHYYFLYVTPMNWHAAKEFAESVGGHLATITTKEENGWIIKDGDTVKIKSLTHIVDMYGIIAKITREGEKYEFPLCDLEVVDTKSKNYQLIDDYRIWFGNR